MSEARPATDRNGGSASAAFDHKLDIRSYVCPMTYVKTKLQLEEMDAGATLGLKIRLGESYNNVTRSLNDDGHKILGERRIDAEAVLLIIEKGKD